MSRADIETLRAGYEAFGRGDWDAVLRRAHPDLELRTADRVTNPGTYKGIQEVRRFFEDLFEPFDEVVAEPEAFFERGHQIVVFALVRSRPRGSNAVVENRIGHVWTMRDGKAARLQIFPALVFSSVSPSGHVAERSSGILGRCRKPMGRTTSPRFGA